MSLAITFAKTFGRSPLLPAIGLLLAAIFDVWLLTSVIRIWTPGFDMYASYAIEMSDPWAGAEASMLGLGVFRWSPVAAQVASIFHVVPWPVFLGLFLALQLAVIVAIAGKRWPFVVLFPPVLFNLWVMNVDLLMGAAIVAGFRRPGFWAFLFLTKVTPGAGVLWFAFRREWMRLAAALATTAAISAVSFAIAPDLWFRWVAALQAMAALPQQAFIPPLLVRLVVAAVMLAWAARTDRRWLVPVTCLVAVPNVWFVAGAVLAGSFALWRTSRWNETSRHEQDADRRDVTDRARRVVTTAEELR